MLLFLGLAAEKGGQTRVHFFPDPVYSYFGGGIYNNIKMFTHL
jgi:hypothetical protein